MNSNSDSNNGRRGRIGRRHRWGKRGVIAVAMVAAVAALGVGSTGAYFTGLVQTVLQPASSGELPGLQGVRAVTSGSNTTVTWPAAAPVGFGASPSVKYTVKRSTMNAFTPGVKATTVASGLTGLSTTDSGTNRVPSLGSREASSISGRADLAFSVIGGKPYGWGNNYVNFSAATPTLVSGVPEEVLSIATGTRHACALTVTGRVFCMGTNDYGQLGNGTTTASSTFVEVSSYYGFKGEDVVQLTAGDSFTCGLGSKGTVACWGVNNYGQLGDSTTTNRSVPTTVATSAGAVPTVFSVNKPIQIAAGNAFVCALKGADRGFAPLLSETVACWGIGGAVVGGTNGSAVTQPVNKPDGYPAQMTGAFKIAAGPGSVCVLNSNTATPNIGCWGVNTSGVLGNGTTTDSSSPSSVNYRAGGTTPAGFTDIAIGVYGACATRGTQYACWGSNWDGQLGIGTQRDGSANTLQNPRDFKAVLDDAPVTGIMVGITAACATVGTGGMACWGYYQTAQPGGQGVQIFPSPVSAKLNGSPMLPTQQASGISSGADAQFSAAVLNKRIYYWGRSNDALNNVSPVLPAVTEPTPIAGFPDTVTKVAAGFDHICASTSTNEVWCVGRNASGELGDGTTTDSPSTAVKVQDPNNAISGKTVADIQAGVGFTCVLFTDGSVACWGVNDKNQLGSASSAAFSSSPVLSLAASPGSGPFSGSGKKPVLLAVSSASVCLGKDGSGVACWGGNDSGELGGASTVGTSSASAIDLVENGSLGTVLGSGPVKSIDGGLGAFCFIANSGGAYCWGKNTWGVLGNGTTTSQKDLVSTGVSGSMVTVGTREACIVLGNGQARCWGSNTKGELGNGAPDAPGVITPANNQWWVVNTPANWSYASLASGAQHTCALGATGGLICWGNNTYYSVGQKTNTPAAMTSAGTVLVSNTSVLGYLNRICVDGSATLNNGASCATPANQNYWYQVTYQVGGADNWVSQAFPVTRDAYQTCDAVYQNAAWPTTFAYSLKNSSVTSEPDLLGRSSQAGLFSGNRTYPSATPVACASTAGTAETSYTTDGNGTYVTPGGTGGSISSPNTFTASFWFKTTVTYGKLFGFGDSATGISSYAYDRHLYLTSDGRLNFGVYTNTTKVVTTVQPVNDGKWHLASATYSNQEGLRFYLDGVLIGYMPGPMTATVYNGWWRVGGDNTAGWANLNGWSNASLRYAAVWPSILTPAEIKKQYIVGAPK